MDKELYTKVLSSLQGQCARKECCVSDIYKKALKALDGDENVANTVLESLKADKFVDDLRYASAYAKEKASLSGWGKVKISYMLSGKGVAKETIAKALDEIDGTSAGRKLDSVLAAKYRVLSGDPQWRLKLLKFALSRGYSYDEVQSAINRLIKY